MASAWSSLTTGGEGEILLVMTDSDIYYCHKFLKEHQFPPPPLPPFPADLPPFHFIAERFRLGPVPHNYFEGDLSNKTHLIHFPLSGPSQLTYLSKNLTIGHQIT